MASTERSTASPKTLKHTFHPLKVAKIIEETHDTKSVVFEIPVHLREVFRYRPGQFLTLEVPHQDVRLRRCYSLASSPDTESEHKVTIKRVNDGRISNWINDRLKPGDVVSVLPPDGRFVVSGQPRHQMHFGGGSGITPIISIVKSTLATTAQRCTLLYANRDERSVIFRAELDELTARYPGRLNVVHHFDVVHGFIQRADVLGLVQSRVDHECFMCGPGPFMDTVEAGLIEAGVPDELIHIERFASLADPSAAGKVLAEDAGDVPATITVELDDEVHEVPYKKGQSLLQAAAAAGLDAPYSCEEGVCGSCAAQLLEGEVHMLEDEVLSLAEKKRGVILTCQSRPTSAKKVRVRYLD